MKIISIKASLHCVLAFYHAMSFANLNDLNYFDDLRGRVNMQGSIIASSCSIATEDREQTIDMGMTTVGEVLRGNSQRSKVFNLHLKNCVIDNSDKASRFSITFEGISDNGIFYVYGTSGIGLKISDMRGELLRPGVPSLISMEYIASQNIQYEIFIVGNGKYLKTGEYHAALRYKMDYY